MNIVGVIVVHTLRPYNAKDERASLVDRTAL